MQCNDPSIHGTASSTLGSYPDLTFLDGPISFPVQGGYGDFGEGAGHAPIQFGYDIFTRTSDDQLENIYGFLDLTLDGTDGVDGWYGATGGGLIECAGYLTRRLRCAFNSIPFKFVPGATTACQAGDAVCGTINGISQSLVGLVNDPQAFLDETSEPILDETPSHYEFEEDLGELASEEPTDDVAAVAAASPFSGRCRYRFEGDVYRVPGFRRYQVDWAGEVRCTRKDILLDGQAFLMRGETGDLRPA